MEFLSGVPLFAAIITLVLGVGLMNATQALEFRRPAKSSPAIEKLFEEYRKVVPFVDVDRVMYTELAKSVEFLKTHSA